MEQIPANHLQEAIELAQQAAAQMKQAAKLAENAAQLWRQALVLANQEDLPQPPAVQMTVAAPERKKTPRIKPETPRLRENAPFRNIPHLAPAPVPAESLVSAQLERGWEDGENWWKPRQPISKTEC